MKAHSLCVVLTLGISACGDDPANQGPDAADTVQNPNASCDATGFGFCTNYEGDASAIESSCNATGTWSETVFCEPEGSCGSCTVDTGDYKATTYYFNGSGSETDSATVCGNGQGVWVDDLNVTCN